MIRAVSAEKLEIIVALKRLVAALVVVFSMFIAAPKGASASTISFDCINCGVGPNFAGFFTGNVVVSPAGTMTVTISNNGGGSIAEIYIDAPGTGAGYLLTSLIESPPNVDFVIGGGNHLPGDNNANPDFESELKAAAGSPSTTLGVNNGESIGLVFTISALLTQSDIDNLLDNGDLRFGIHVQALPGLTGDDSRSFVSGDPCTVDCDGSTRTVTPEPASMLLLGTGLLVVAHARRKKNV